MSGYRRAVDCLAVVYYQPADGLWDLLPLKPLASSSTSVLFRNAPFTLGLGTQSLMYALNHSQVFANPAVLLANERCDHSKDHVIHAIALSTQQSGALR